MAADGPFIEATIAGEPRLVPIAAGFLRIGRGDDNDLALVDGLASRDHALIRRDAGGRCHLSDLGSRNGTLLNGRAVTAPARLADGDVIEVGEHRLRFREPTRAAEGAPFVATQVVFPLRLITVLVCDLRGSARLGRELSDGRLARLTSALFREVGAALDRAGCWSQKFIGDALMAVWVHDGEAVPAAKLADLIRLVEALDAIARRLTADHQLAQPLRFGAAINSGRAQIGNMGSASAADFTALGDPVIKAFRLEDATRRVGCDLLVGGATLDLLGPALPAGRRPPLLAVALEGFDGAEPAHRLEIDDLAWFARLLES